AWRRCPQASCRSTQRPVAPPARPPASLHTSRAVGRAGNFRSRRLAVGFATRTAPTLELADGPHVARTGGARSTRSSYLFVDRTKAPAISRRGLLQSRDWTADQASVASAAAGASATPVSGTATSPLAARWV